MTEIDPLMAMSPPGSCLRAVTASTKSPSSCSEFRHVNRHDHLAGVAQALGEVGVLLALGLAVGPGAGEAVVGLAPEEERVGAGDVGVDGRAHLVVEVREVPLVGRLDNAVEGDEQAGNDLPHR
jgi:hypothetical protein